MRYLLFTYLAAMLLAPQALATAERFPPPQFESGYELPSPTTPPPRADFFEYMDVVVLFAALGVSTYFILKRRSRRLIFAAMIFALLYFGFYRNGCVCAIGAVQNASLTACDSTYALPITVLLFLLLPLVFTLFYGRAFCASVCPLGAVQDLVAVKPISVPLWLESGLRLLAYVYLGLAILFAATGSAFIICRYDPFVGFFRVTGNFNMIVVGFCLLAIGVFVGRPYCRFLCPYGVILRQVSRVSKRRVTITPDECIKCRLCEDACPFGAIRSPTADWVAEDYKQGKKRLVLLLILVPVLMLLVGWGISLASDWMARAHSTVRLADRIHLEESGQVSDTTDASAAFRATGRQIEDLYDEAEGIEAQMAAGSWLVGGFLGLVVGVKLIRHSVRRTRTDYEADAASCFACGRCFDYCPREHVRRKSLSKDKETES